MSTTPTPAPSTGFCAKLKQYAPLIEQAINVGLIASGVGAAFEPLAAGLEGALNPLLTSSATTTSTVIMNVYVVMIGILTTLKATTGLDPAVLAQVNAYLVAAEEATAAYVQAESGFNPANYTPVTPIP